MQTFSNPLYICKMEIRLGDKSDLNELLELFKNTVQHVNVKDYSPEQIEVWAAATNNVKGWEERMENDTFLVATEQGKVVGFSSINTVGYLNFMYVHHQFQKQGIATALLEKVEEKAREYGCKSMYASVSVTAQPFFAFNSFKHVADDLRIVEGVEFMNSKMEKMLI